MTSTDTAAARIQAAQQAMHAAQAAFEQTVRDEVAAERLNPSDVARALGTKNRQRVYAILGRGEDGGEPTQPSARPVVYLRGAGCGDATWERVRAAMWARGWRTVSDRTTAWHLARGGELVVFADFSSEYDGLSLNTVTVGQVRAKYAEVAETVTVLDLLTTSDAARLMRARADWLGEQVESVTMDTELPLVNGGEHPRPERHDPDAVNNIGRRGAYVLDAEALARLVADALA